MRSRAALLAAALAAGCATPSATQVPRRSPLAFLDAATSPWPAATDDGRLVSVAPGSDRVAIYDNALAILLDVRLGRRRDAERILSALVRLQREDGSLVFSFDRAHADEASPYVRSGALAWVGFAAVMYLDAEREGDGGARAAIARMCHELARYLLAHQIHAIADPRDGLITGGEGSFTYDVVGGHVRETFVPGAIAWASTEHNVDAYFFLRALARVAARPDYAEAAERIRAALAGRLWDAGARQMKRGVDAAGGDPVLALDCASWGSLFFLASGDRPRAEASFAAADTLYPARAPEGAGSGHRPFLRGPLLESVALARTYALPARDWRAAPAVWPEGSAGVALAALRLGDRARAAAIVAALEPLRDPGGGLPTLTIDVPFEFDRAPSVAGTAWVELVRDEIARPAIPPTLWPTEAAGRAE